MYIETYFGDMAFDAPLVRTFMTELEPELTPQDITRLYKDRSVETLKNILSTCFKNIEARSVAASQTAAAAAAAAAPPAAAAAPADSVPQVVRAVQFFRKHFILQRVSSRVKESLKEFGLPPLRSIDASTCGTAMMGPVEMLAQKLSELPRLPNVFPLSLACSLGEDDLFDRILAHLRDSSPGVLNELATELRPWIDRDILCAVARKLSMYNRIRCQLTVEARQQSGEDIVELLAGGSTAMNLVQRVLGIETVNNLKQPSQRGTLLRVPEMEAGSVNGLEGIPLKLKHSCSNRKPNNEEELKSWDRATQVMWFYSRYKRWNSQKIRDLQEELIKRGLNKDGKDKPCLALRVVRSEFFCTSLEEKRTEIDVETILHGTRSFSDGFQENDTVSCPACHEASTSLSAGAVLRCQNRNCLYEIRPTKRSFVTEVSREKCEEQFAPGDEVEASRTAAINAGSKGWERAQVLKVVQDRGYLVEWKTGDPEYDTVVPWTHVRQLTNDIPEMSFFQSCSEVKKLIRHLDSDDARNMCRNACLSDGGSDDDVRQKLQQAFNMRPETILLAANCAHWEEIARFYGLQAGQHPDEELLVGLDKAREALETSGKSMDCYPENAAVLCVHDDKEVPAVKRFAKSIHSTTVADFVPGAAAMPAGGTADATAGSTSGSAADTAAAAVEQDSDTEFPAKRRRATAAASERYEEPARRIQEVTGVSYEQAEATYFEYGDIQIACNVLLAYCDENISEDTGNTIEELSSDNECMHGEVKRPTQAARKKPAVPRGAASKRRKSPIPRHQILLPEGTDDSEGTTDDSEGTDDSDYAGVDEGVEQSDDEAAEDAAAVVRRPEGKGHRRQNKQPLQPLMERSFTLFTQQKVRYLTVYSGVWLHLSDLISIISPYTSARSAVLRNFRLKNTNEGENGYLVIPYLEQTQRGLFIVESESDLSRRLQVSAAANVIKESTPFVPASCVHLLQLMLLRDMSRKANHTHGDNVDTFPDTTRDALLAQIAEIYRSQLCLEIPADTFSVFLVQETELQSRFATDSAPEPSEAIKLSQQQANEMEALVQSLTQDGTDIAGVLVKLSAAATQKLEAAKLVDPQTGIHWVTSESLKASDRDLCEWPRREDALREAREKLGVEQFKPLQAEILAAISRGKDVLAVLPPGYGKSLLFQLPMLCSCIQVRQIWEQSMRELVSQ